VNCFDTFSLVAMLATMRVLLDLVVGTSVNISFLCEDLYEEVYMVVLVLKFNVFLRFVSFPSFFVA